MMKIKNVEISRSEDGTSSTGSTGSSDLQLDTPIVMGDPELEQSIKTLSVALTDVHGQLQDKTTECEALLATVAALSEALKESDRLLETKSLECERLELKLQMVTFVERGELPDPPGASDDIREDVDNDELPLTAADGPPKPESTPKAKVTPVPPPKTSTESSGNRITPGSSARPKKLVEKKSPVEPPAGPVSVDEDPDDDATSVVGGGPRQAHFYKVIAERDKALSSVKKLTKELKHAKAKVKELKGRVDRSTALVEISYDEDDKSSKSEVSTQQRKPNKSVSWLRKNGRSVRGKSNGEETNNEVETFADFISDEEMLPERWNSKEKRSEEDYLKAIASSDADRAGGIARGSKNGSVESIRFQL